MQPGDRIEVSNVAQHVWVVAVHGEHDLSNASQLDDAISGVFAAGSRMVIDLTDASFIDSSVLSGLLQAREKANQQSSDDLVVVAPPETMPRRVIDMIGLAAWIPIFDNRQAALDAIA
jgi:anti-sigma B factor antagonist